MKIFKNGAILFLLLALFALNLYAKNNSSRNFLPKKRIELKQNNNPVLFMRSFFKWYKANLHSFHNAFVDINAEAPKPYRINFTKTEQYLSTLLSSGFFSKKYIDYYRKYFKKIDLTLQKTKQDDGAVDGLDYDLIMHTQEPESYLNDLKTIQLSIVKSNLGGAIIKVKSKVDPMFGEQFTLIKIKYDFLIEKIGVIQ